MDALLKNVYQYRINMQIRLLRRIRCTGRSDGKNHQPSPAINNTATATKPVDCRLLSLPFEPTPS